MIAGDAAHLMPVWQGQGYNSGIRDAANLGWKLAAVVNGQADDALLDTYDVERRKHARAMIDLSTMVGRVISPTNRRVAALRDRVIHAASVVPPLKRYILEMRFKPMPRYEQGAVFHAEPRVGHLADGHAVHPAPCRHPRAAERPARRCARPGFAVLCWSNNPRALLGDEAFERWKALGAKFVAVRPMTQLHWTGHDDPDVVIVGDRTGALKAWFDANTDSVLFLRPDRCIAGCLHRPARAASSAHRCSRFSI